jgi:hypothetical protein
LMKVNLGEAVRVHSWHVLGLKCMQANLVKAAELASGLGAIVLGAGLALIAPDVLRAYAAPMVAAGLVAHGAGMTLKYRLEGRQGAPLWWERVLFWLCWACLIGLTIWMAVMLARR